MAQVQVIVSDNQDRSVLPSGSSIESIALGFNEHPHKISMRKSGLKGQKIQAQNRLNHLTKLMEDTKNKAETCASQAAELRKKPDPANAKKLESLESQKKRYEGEAEKYVPQVELAKANLEIVANKLQNIEQKRMVRIARYTLMKARWDSAPADQIKRAEVGVGKAEDELGRLQSAIVQAEKRVAELVKK